MPDRRAQPAVRRRQHIRRVFDSRVREEWSRYAREPRRVLHGVLRERFLRRHLAGVDGLVLELGPGPGRFTPIVRERPRDRVIAVDLSRAGLITARRRSRGGVRGARVDWVQAAGEFLPLSQRSADAAVVLGNIVSFASDQGASLLRELGRVVRPGGVLVADFASPASATQEFLFVAARSRFLRRVLRRPRYYLLDSVLGTGFQPYDPARLSRWEFRFYTAAEATALLRRSGFRVIDLMSVAPLAAQQERIVEVSRREPRTWSSLIRLEERLGRRPGLLEAGDGFIVSAVRAR